MFHGLDRRLHRSVPGNDDHKRFRTLGFDVPESFETTRSGEPEVEQDGIDGLGLEQAISLFGGIGYMRHEPEGAGDFAASFPDGAFVVDDEKVEIIGGQNLRGGDRWTYSC
jgi:hypothetical protein